MDNDWTLEFLLKTDKGNLGTNKPIELDFMVLALCETPREKARFIAGELEAYFESVMIDYEAKQCQS